MASSTRRPRLRRSDCSGPGLRRRRRGRGFVYLDENGHRIENPEIVARLRDLAIPPAWDDVWICSDPLGHLQATGIDAAGRKQYLYHELWRERRDQEKFQKMLRFAQTLPRLRRRVTSDLREEDLSSDRVLACAARLLDVGLFRVGGEEYAETGGGLGLATLEKRHAAVRNGSIEFDYPAKGGIRRVHAIDDASCAEVVVALKRRRGGGQGLLAYQDGRGWVPLRSEDINNYLKRHMGEDFSAKDFRTWNATVLTATALAADRRDSRSVTSRRRTVNAAVRSVSEVLGNTPAIARRSYIDPRVIDSYLSGSTIAPALARLDDLDSASERKRRRVELAVLKLLSD